jgi:pSer/pThr/pTyr-binding forkhead associated (FHA) protein
LSPASVWPGAVRRTTPKRKFSEPEICATGRHPGSDIFLDDVTVSRRHAEFRREGGEFNVVDVGSLNGTYVNREPIDSAELTNGDEIHMGKFRLVFLTGPRRIDTDGVGERGSA